VNTMELSNYANIFTLRIIYKISQGP
jgi:hypothetical protein